MKRKLKFVRVLSMMLSILLISQYSMASIDIKASENKIVETISKNGDITQDIVWDNINEPYELTQDINIKNGSKLTIEPGVEIQGNGYSINVYGELDVNGAKFEKTKIIAKNKDSEYCTITLKNSKMVQGSLSIGNHAKLEISNNKFLDLEGNIYIWYPEGEVYIIGNIFENCGGLSIGSNYNTYIRNNVFYKMKTEYAVNNWAQYNSMCYVEKNSFYDIGNVLSIQYSSGKIEAKNNFWNTTNDKLIANRIKDGNKDFSINWVVEYLPILSKPDVNTPKVNYNVPEEEPTEEDEVVTDIIKDTIWNNINEPYELTKDVQIKKGVKLIIAPGVEIQGNGYSINVYGELDVDGAKFEEIEISPGNAGDNNYCTIILRNSEIIGGRLLNPTGNSAHTKLELTNNKFQNLTGYTYIWYPEGETYITRNVFDNCGGLSIGSKYNTYIRNNVFYNMKTDYAIENWAQYDSMCYVEKNSFYDTGKVLSIQYSSGKIEAKNNFWNTTNEKLITNRIKDGNKDFSIPWVVEYLPILSNPDVNTPKVNYNVPEEDSENEEIVTDIIKDTVWDNTNEPYELTKDVQIKNGAKLTIAPGVEIQGNGYRIKVYGELDVDGAKFEEIEISPGNAGDNNYCTIILRNSEIIGGRLLNPTGNSAHTKLELTNNKFLDLEGNIYIWYPDGEVYITGNIFENCGGLSIGSNYNTYVRNNVFYKMKTEYAVNNWAQYNSMCYVEKNSFYDTGNVLSIQYSSGKMEAKNNFWDTTNEKLIANRIRDGNKDFSITWIVEYLPILLTPDSNTPKPVMEVSLDKISATIEKGEILELIATVSPNYASNKNLIWTSSDTSIASVDENGKVTGIKAGTVIITVTTEDGLKKTSCKVTVENSKKEDLNNDGVIDIRDLSMLALKYNIKEDNTYWDKTYDLNNDGIIDIFDLIIISKKIE